MQALEVKNPPGHEIDVWQLIDFERGLDPEHPEESQIPAQILGFGEISTVFAIEGLDGLAFKRLPIFNSSEELSKYLSSYAQYIELLEEKAGISTVNQGYVILEEEQNPPIFYIVQTRAEKNTIAHHALVDMSNEEIKNLFSTLLHKLERVWSYNAGQDKFELGIDGQISNWIINSRGDDYELIYLDTSTPLFRVNSEEQLNTELFLRSAPSFLRWILRWFLLSDVVNRYYDFRLVVVDAIANLYKEHQPQAIPIALKAAEQFFSNTEKGPITASEVHSYYREDAFIWTLYLGLRRVDRRLHKLVGRSYPYMLPGNIDR